MAEERVRVFTTKVSWPGVVTGIFFFDVSLLPSMLPRSGLLQGVISGVAFLMGYGIGVAGQWAWNYLEIPLPRGRFWRILRYILYLLLIWITVTSMWQNVGRQNSVRELFGMETVGPAVWLTTVPVALATAALLLVIVRSFRKLFRFLARWFDRVLPGRLARLLGGVALGLIIWGLWSGVLVNGFFAVANQIFEPRDTTTHEGIVQPTSDLVSGSDTSPVSWESLGRQGRRFVATATPTEDLNDFWGEGALEPIRVYVGLKSAETLEERANLVLDELIRTGAFERSTLIVATTTGTGFLEPNAMTALDFVHNGDVAVAGVQYSYLPSWISLLADQEKVKETSQLVFNTIHAHWSDMPEDSRPDIYLYGLSLGSFGVESVLTSVEIINEPINGAVMVGPPFVNPFHERIVSGRDAGSNPATAIYEDGKTVRFTNAENQLSLPTGDWENTRLAYLQHGSDPVVWFNPDLAFSQPDWLIEEQKAVDITDDFVWFPLVTMFQVLIDMANAGSVPEGFGHLYTKQANSDVWIAVTAPDMADDVAADLRQFLIELGPAE